MLFNNRRKYFIQKDFQARIILRFVAAASVWAAAAVMLFIFLAEEKLERLRFSSHIDITRTSELLLPAALAAHILSLLVFMALLSYAIRSLWKKLAPPLAALKKDIAQVAAGELSRAIVLRDKDEFRELAENLEEMRQGLRDKIDCLKISQQALDAASAQLSAATLSGKPSAQDTAALQLALERMQEAIQAFQV